MNFTNLSVNEINRYLTTLNQEELIKCLAFLAHDKRITVQNIVKKYQRLIDKRTKELERCRALWSLEKEILEKGYRFVAGVDEAGRGPIAGPVVAGAVILSPFCVIEGLNDSKKLSSYKREQIASRIKEEALAWAVGVVDAKTIDRINILEATRYAMHLAVESLKIKPDYILLDGYENPLFTIPQTGVIDGDALSASIAAASIIAKVHRDKLMNVYDRIYPGYNFKQNKGYGTVEHQQALETIGPCPIHRQSFKPVQDKQKVLVD